MQDDRAKQPGKSDHREEAAAWSWLASHSLEERTSLLDAVRVFNAWPADLRSRLFRVVALSEGDPELTTALEEAIAHVIAQRGA